MKSILRFGGAASVVALAWVLVTGTSGCSSSSSGSQSASATSASNCSSLCAPLQAAHCPNDSPDCAGECASEQAGVPAACQSQNQALLTCAMYATFACDSTGEASPVGCDSEIAGYAGCLQANPSTAGEGGAGVTATGDAGEGNPNPSSGCQTTGSSCNDCVATSCCTETQVCNADSSCSLLSTCLTRCISTDQACTSACRNLYPSATGRYDNVANCVSQSCTYACTEPPAGCTYVSEVSATGCSSTSFPVPWSCASGPPQEPVPCDAAPSGAANVYCCLE